MENASWGHNNVFERRRVFEGRRRRGVCVQLNIYLFLCQTFAQWQLLFSPLQAMSGSSSVEGRRDILARRGVEVIIFLRQEGCQDLQEDRRGNQSSHGKSTKLVKNWRNFLFLQFFFSQESHTYIYMIFFLYLVLYCKNRFTFTPFTIILFFFRYYYQFSSLSGVSILGRAIVAIVRIRLYLIRTGFMFMISFSSPPSFLRLSEAK